MCREKVSHEIHLYRSPCHVTAFVARILVQMMQLPLFHSITVARYSPLANVNSIMFSSWMTASIVLITFQRLAGVCFLTYSKLAAGKTPRGCN